MSGMTKGCLTSIQSAQPLSKYFHCSAHCANLVAQAFDCSPIRDFMGNHNEFSVLFRRSINISKYHQPTQ